MIVGIDPGITGAIAFLSEGNKLDKVFDMPVMPYGTPKKKKPGDKKKPAQKQQVNAAELVKILNRCEIGMVYLEYVAAAPDQGVTAMFNFGMHYGVIQGICAGLYLPMTLVTPQSWKKRAGLIGKDKDYSRTLAQQLYPEAELGRKKDIGRADAILIARFGI